MAEGIYVKQDDVEIEDGAAKISSPELAKAFEADKEGVASFLASEAAPVDVGDVSVDESGRVVVRNKAFAEAVEPTREPDTDPGNNLLCGYAC
jgi:hypothetical protein